MDISTVATVGFPPLTRVPTVVAAPGMQANAWIAAQALGGVASDFGSAVYGLITGVCTFTAERMTLQSAAIGVGLGVTITVLRSPRGRQFVRQVGTGLLNIVGPRLQNLPWNKIGKVCAAVALLGLYAWSTGVPAQLLYLSGHLVKGTVELVARLGLLTFATYCFKNAYFAATPKQKKLWAAAGVVSLTIAWYFLGFWANRRPMSDRELKIVERMANIQQMQLKVQAMVQELNWDLNQLLIERTSLV